MCYSGKMLVIENCHLDSLDFHELTLKVTGRVKMVDDLGEPASEPLSVGGRLMLIEGSDTPAKGRRKWAASTLLHQADPRSRDAASVEEGSSGPSRIVPKTGEAPPIAIVGRHVTISASTVPMRVTGHTIAVNRAVIVVLTVPSAVAAAEATMAVGAKVHAVPRHMSRR